MTTSDTSTTAAPPVANAARAIRRTPRDFWHMFTERWWLGALGAAIAAGVVIWFRPHFEPIYTTEVSLLFEVRKDRVLNIQEVVDNSLQTASELNTHMEQIRSTTFANYVFASFNKAETDLIQAAYLDPLHPGSPPPPLASIIRPNLTITNRRNTPIVSIIVSHRSPEAAALIANRYARKYIDYNLDGANTRTNSAIVFLRNQAEEMRTQVTTAEAALQTYRTANNLAAIGETQNIVLQKMASLGTALVKAQLDQIDAKSLLDKIAEYQRNHQNLLEIPQILSSGQVSNLNNALLTQISQRAILAERYLPQHPKVKENELQITETRRMLNEAIEKAIADLRARYDVASQYVSRLKEEMAGSEVQARQLDKISVDYKFLDQDANAKRVTYARIMDRLNEATITSQMANANIGIFDPAWVPDSPSDTGALSLTIRAAAIALACLIFIPLAAGFLDSRLRTPAQIEESLNERVLGVVKRMPKMSTVDRAQVFRHAKNQDLAEAYRGIFTEVEVSSTVGFPKAILITSSLPHEGKSILSSNLAAVFAAHGHRTLLIDADLRRPAIGRYFGIKTAEAGWVNWLETPADDRPPAPTGIISVSAGFDLLIAGRTSERSTELLDRLSNRDVLQPLLQSYDVVLFDTPPAAVFPDALMIARCCHELIYVCRYRTVRPAVVRKVLDRFRSTGVGMLGIVLSQLPERKAEAYGYHGYYGTQGAEYYKAYAKDSA